MYNVLIAGRGLLSVTRTYECGTVLGVAYVDLEEIEGEMIYSWDCEVSFSVMQKVFKAVEIFLKQPEETISMSMEFKS